MAMYSISERKYNLFMEIETDRLRIVPLTVEQFLLLLCDMKRLGENMNILFTEKSLDYDTWQAMEGLYKESLSHLENYYWYTNWQIILKSENRSVGSACFMKEPDDKGLVEIGYGIDKAYRNNGYMTEALTGMC